MNSTITKSGLPRKYTRPPMTFVQRRVLEVLSQLGTVSIYEVADAMQSTRDRTKSTFDTLVKQGFIERVTRVVRDGKGSTPATFKWTGKGFPSSSEIVMAAVASQCAIALVVQAMNAMVHAGRAQA